MCNNNCQNLEKLKGKPEECSPKQIKECHGNSKTHTCDQVSKKETVRNESHYPR